MNIQKHHLMLFISIVLTGEVQAVEKDFGAITPTKAQVIAAFKPELADPIETAVMGQHEYEGDVVIGKERNISFKLNGANPKLKPSLLRDAKVQKQVEGAISMQVYFDYNSAELSDIAKNKLKPVGEALASNELKSLDFIIEGHTDAVGGDAFNKALSNQRAATVKHYFIKQFQVSSSKINAIGKGESYLLDPRHPTSEVNRRVRIVAFK